ncbi:MAG: hypothetical protein OEY44_00195 [Candidatus Peregrinibacteria bacterium]|nr:hypothetical protein [Candidatus Peregrinibacteria bacterium]
MEARKQPSSTEAKPKDLGELIEKIQRNATEISEEDMKQLEGQFSLDGSRRTFRKEFTEEDRRLITALFHLTYPDYSELCQMVDAYRYEDLGRIRNMLTILFLFQPALANRFELWKTNQSKGKKS